MKTRIWLLASLAALSACNPSATDSEEEESNLAKLSCEIGGLTTQLAQGEQTTANLACDLTGIHQQLQLVVGYDASVINLSASGESQAQAGSIKITLPRNSPFKSTLSLQGLKTGKSQIELKVKDFSKTWDFAVIPSIDFRSAGYKLASGISHSLLIKEDGTLWAWGVNNDGQLGDGTNADRLAPVQIGSDNNWKILASNGAFSLAIKKEGSLWAWGRNRFRQLGDGTNTDRFAPVQIAGSWKLVSAGYFHTLALKGDNTLWAWGDNRVGQLGDGTTTIRTTPTKIGSDQWTSVSSGYGHTLGLKTDGTLWAWGFNRVGQLGDGTNTNRTTPTKIGSGNDWQEIHTKSVSSFAIKKDGSLWAWGSNIDGQLGDGTNTDRLAPVQISGHWKAVSSGGDADDSQGFHTLGIKSGGSLWAWGSDSDGRLGLGAGDQSSNRPIQLGSDTDWVAVEAGDSYSVAVKSNGEVWAWGGNNFGRLGDGTNINRDTPVKVRF